MARTNRTKGIEIVDGSGFTTKRYVDSNGTKDNGNGK